MIRKFEGVQGAEPGTGRAGINLHVHVRGQGPTLVWGHGMMSSMAAEDGLLGLWDGATPGVRLLRYDARGHGLSPAGRCWEDFTWQRLGADMLDLDDGSVVLGGWSMGCAAAIHAALAAPERVRALVLMLPPLFWEARVGHAALYRRGAALGQRLGERRMGRLMQLAGAGGEQHTLPALPTWLARARPDAAAAHGASMACLSGLAMARMYEGAAASDLPSAEALAAIADMPALVIGWQGDTLHPFASCQLLHSLLPRSQLRLLAGEADLRRTGQEIADFVRSRE